MADICDRAEVEEFSTRAQISNIRNRGRELHPCGECHYCGIEFEVGNLRLFCDSECSMEYEKSK